MGFQKVRGRRWAVGGHDGNDGNDGKWEGGLHTAHCQSLPPYRPTALPPCLPVSPTIVPIEYRVKHQWRVVMIEETVKRVE